MKKILHLITDLETGGAEMMLYKLISKMDNKRFSNIVVSLTDKGTLGERIENLGIRVFTLDMRRGIPNPFALIKLIKIIKKEKPDIIQTWLYHADLFGLVVAKFMGITKIFWNIRCSELKISDHGYSLFSVLKILAIFSRVPRGIIVNSMAGQQFHVKLGYINDKFIYIPNGFDTEHFRPNNQARIIMREKININRDSFIIGIIARYDPMKDHKTFLKAAYQLSLINKSIKFIMVGRNIDHKNTELMKGINELGLKNNVYLLGERHDMHLVYPMLDVLISSSYSEGFPSVIAEAMACGIPCVATDVGQTAEILGDTGLLVPPSDSDAIAKAVLALINLNMNDRLELGEKARQRVIDKYSLENVVSEYERIYIS